MDEWNIGSADKQSVFDALASVIKAMANGRRLEIIEVLAQGEHSVEVVARMLDMGLTTTSAHLQRLKRAGLVAARRDGTTVFYRLAGNDVAELYVSAKRVGLRRSADLRDALGAYMDQVEAVPSPVSIDPSAVTSDMTVIDVRPREEFDAGHFPGAMSVPLGELEDRFGELPTEGELVVYCRGEFCRLAREAASWLRERGVNAKAMDEGVIEWRATQEVDLHAAS